MMEKICKISILFTAGFLLLDSLLPVDLSYATGIAGLVVLLSGLPSVGQSYKKPSYVFLALSLIIFIKYRLSLAVLVSGVNYMFAVSAIVVVMQLFAIPVKVGSYDKTLEKFLQQKYKKESSLYIFLKLVTHLFGSFMLFGCVPMLFAIFNESLNKMVQQPKRFIATALNRGFSLVTMWAPSTVNVVLVLQVTGVKWLQVLIPAVFLTVLGLATSFILEIKFHLQGRPIKEIAMSGSAEESADREDQKKFRTLILISALLIALIVVMEKFQIMTGTTRVMLAGLLIVSVWILRYWRNPGMSAALQEYWNKSIFVARDLAALFIAMGIFAEGVSQSGMMAYIQTGMMSGIGVLGQYSFLLVPLVLVLLSLIGIHPFISILLIGKILLTAVQLPHYDVIIALSLLVGGVISFVLSPFAGNILTISRMVDVSPKEVGYKWNGLFSLIFLLEGFVFLFILQMFWK